MTTGLWLVGAGGNVATTVALGLSLVARGLSESLGMVTESAALRDLPLVSPAELVVGGHEIAAVDPVAVARQLCQGDRLITAEQLALAEPALVDYGARIRPGVSSSSPSRKLIERVRADLEAFARTEGLARVVVVNLASTEAHMSEPLPQTAAELETRLASGPVPASVIYAVAAVELGMGYVNFTPSTGASMPALEALARETGAALAGRDGKTGETLLKAALAPMFAARNLRVRSWFGQNILGNSDGRTLADPEARSSKQKSKGSTLPSVLGYQPEAHVGIDYVPSLGDWKIAWDHIAFEGFLGTRMSMQFTWQGADSILAAPLVIDLARLVALAMDRGETGVLSHLAVFFKEPAGCDVHGLEAQHRMLVDHLLGYAGGSS